MIVAHTKSADDTRTFAAALATSLRDGDLLLLVGEIGAGKTTFAQGLGQGLGVTEPITSPTFVLLQTYQGTMPMHHVDIYRLDHLQEVIDLGLLELLDDGGIALMEWGDLASPVLPQDLLEIRMLADHDNEDSRTIELNAVGDGWSARESALRSSIAQWTVMS